MSKEDETPLTCRQVSSGCFIGSAILVIGILTVLSFCVLVYIAVAK